jgi:eukaryotic-like serine/threonine-protein kinase
MDLTPPERTVLSHRYRLHTVLGTGGMSVVWRAHDDVLDRPVAVKLLSRALDTTALTRLRAEARAVGRLHHPSIAQVFDFARTDDGIGYLVMELVTGDPLSHVLRERGRLPWPEAVDIAAELADALAFAHDRGLVHRDVKPANIIVHARGAKLIDFGICATVGSADSTDGQLLGTPAYVAPERIDDAPVGPEADVYALGMLLYRMLTGALPWEVDTDTGIMSAHLFTDPTPMPDIPGMPAGIGELVLTCLVKEPVRRPDAAALATMLHELRAEPTLADPAEAAPAPAGRRRISRYAIPVAAAGTLALAAGTALAWPGGTPVTTPAASAATTPAACTATYTVALDSGHRFQARITVDDHSLRLTAPTVSFFYPGDQRLSPPAGTARHTGATHASGVPVTLSQTGGQIDVTFDRFPVSAGDTLTLDATGAYTIADTLPTAVALGGHPCTTYVTGASTPTVTPAPTSPGAPVRGTHTAAPRRTSTGHGSSAKPAPPAPGGPAKPGPPKPKPPKPKPHKPKKAPAPPKPKP